MGYGKIVGNPEFYIAYSILTSTDTIKDGKVDVLSLIDAKKLMTDLGIVVNKLPKVSEINTKTLPKYEVRK